MRGLGEEPDLFEHEGSADWAKQLDFIRDFDLEYAAAAAAAS